MAWVRTADNKLYKDSNGDKVDTKDYKNIPYELWNSTSVISLLNDLNMEKYGMEPPLNSIKLTRMDIAEDLNEFGAEVLEEFCKRSVNLYKGNLRYPTLSYRQAKMFYGKDLFNKIIHSKVAEQKALEDDGEGIEW